MSTLVDIARFPIKGFGAQRLSHVMLTQDRGLPYDRYFALRNGQGAVAQDGGWTSCQSFVRMTTHACLPQYRVAFTEKGETVTITHPTGETLNVRFDAPEQVAHANRCLQEWFAVSDGGLIHAAPALGYWDHRDAAISIINVATVMALSDAAGVEIDAARFRGNFLVDGLAAWEEFSWVGKRLRIGEAELEVLRPIDRCKATSINPATGEVDANIPLLLHGKFGHVFCGVYARVVKAGAVQTGNKIDVVGDALHAVMEGAKVDTAPPVDQWPRYATVRKRVNEDEHVVSFWLDDPLTCLYGQVHAGQHIRIHGGESSWRCYTLSAVAPTGTLRISVKREAAGVFSNWLHASVKEGDRLLISGPSGAMRLPSLHASPVVLLSAGIGITPTVAILHELVARCHCGEVIVLHSARSKQHLALWEEARECLSQLPQAIGKLHLTQGATMDSPANHAVVGQRMTAADVQAWVRPGASYFLCGPLPFLTMVRAALADAGVDASYVHADVFTSPSLTNTAPRVASSTEPRRIRFAKSGKDVLWKPDCGSLLELADASGVRVNAACRSGVCQACAAPIRSGGVEHLLEPAMPLAKNVALLCCAAPTSDLVLDV